jgi:hypothetical protein
MSIQHSTAGGGGGNDWTIFAEMDGSTLTGWTSEAGTWATTGASGYLHNTVAASSYLSLDEKIEDAADVMVQWAMRFPTTGQSAGDYLGSIMLGRTGAVGEIGPRAALRKITTRDFMGVTNGTSAWKIQYTLDATWSLDTWYTMRFHNVGGQIAVWMDGTYLTTVEWSGPVDAGLSNLADRLVLASGVGIVQYKDIKVWTKPSLPSGAV